MSELAEKFAVNCKSSMPGTVSRSGMARANEHVRTMLHQVRSAHLASKDKKTKHWIGGYLNSYDAHLLAAEKARRAMQRHYFPKALVPTIASGLDPWAGTPEEVRVNFIPKGSDPDDRRITMDFGPKNRTLQYLVKGLLQTLAYLHPHQFGTGNGGLHAAIKHVVQVMQDGHLWAVEIDIEKCFLSFDADKVVDLLPLPKEVTERVVLSRHLNLVPGNLVDIFAWESRDEYESHKALYGPNDNDVPATQEGAR